MKEIVSPSMNVPYCIEKHLRANNSSTNELVFRIRFAPVDLITNHDHRTVPYNIPDGLKRLYKSDMDKFLSKIKLISQLRENEDLSYKTMISLILLFFSDMQVTQVRLLKMCQ